MTKTFSEKLGDAMAQSFASIEEEDRKAAPLKARLEELRRSTPRVIHRDNGRSSFGNLRPSYHPLRLADVHYTPKHVETFHYFGDSREHKRTRGPEIHVSSHVYPAARIGEFIRRPTAKALRRLEEAEETLRLARLAVRDAERAAFTYGRPVTLAAVQDVTRRKKAAHGGEE